MNSNLILEAQRLTSPTVKVRRLGYLASIPSLAQSGAMSLGTIKRHILEWSKKKKNYVFFVHYSLQLPVVRRKKKKLVGEITTLGAAGRYLGTAEELGLIAKTRYVRSSKLGNVLSALSTQGNPFELTLGQSLLLLRLLLERDYDSLRTLYYILMRKEKDEIGFFQREIQKRLYQKIEIAKKMNRLYLVDSLKKSIGDVKNWRSADRYYPENIRAPRLEWMLDLKFLTYWNQRSKTFVLRDNVQKFFEKDIISNEWLQEEYPHKFSEFYSVLLKGTFKKWKDISVEERLKLVKSLLVKGTQLFKTNLTLGRISADQFFDYSLAALIQNKYVVASFSEFERDLMEFMTSKKLNYRYVQTVSKADRGYILNV